MACVSRFLVRSIAFFVSGYGSGVHCFLFITQVYITSVGGGRPAGQGNEMGFGFEVGACLTDSGSDDGGAWVVRETLQTAGQI